MTDRKNSAKNFLTGLLAALMICVLSLGGNRAVKAAEERSEEEIRKAVEAGRDSIVRIESVCWDGEEEVYKTKSFSGFVVSEDTSGIYIITVQKNLLYSSEEKEKIKAEYELEENARISEKIEVVFRGDLRVEANIFGVSEQRNLTVLKLNQAVNFENPLSFAKQNAADNTRIFLLSYPAVKDQKEAIYNIENVKIEQGNVKGYYKQDKIIFFNHDIQADTASAGGVLLDTDGAIAGLFLTSGEGEKGTAISAEELKSFLGTFHIAYQESAANAAEDQLPILPIALGGVIAALLLFFGSGLLKERRIRHETPKKNRANTQREETVQKKSKMETHQNVYLEYPAEKRVVMIHKAEFVIGRAQNADFILSESSGVSRKHACIQYNDKRFYLVDLQSKNYTYLNGVRLMPGEKKFLHDRDEIMAARERLIFHTR